MSLTEQINIEKLPQHIAIIMDGNGRWAKKKGNLRIFGHKSGVSGVRNASEACAELGVQYLTLYAFSTENWSRPKLEVSALMELLINTIHTETKTLIKNNIRLNAIGQLTDLPLKAKKELEGAIDATKDCTGLTLTLALSYSSKVEITNAVKEIALKVKNNDIAIDDIDDHLFADHLSTKNLPDPDLLIRTSGEKRISNFLLWQLAYAELYFTEVLWPDFTKEELHKAIIDYQQRERRFGKTSEQVN